MAKKNNPEMEGGVSRAIDFNLKKEDLMLLILEGRKELMEENIGTLQTRSTTLRTELAKLQSEFKEKMVKKVLKTLNAEAKRIAQGFGKREEGAEEVDLDKVFKVELSGTSDYVDYTHFESRPIGDGKGSTYIKVQNQRNVELRLFRSVKVSIDISLHGETFANKNDMFYRKDYVRACSEYAREFVLVEDDLDREYQKNMDEFKKMQAKAEELAQNESLLSDILAEYDLFNRNQPRAKAKMIKEVLGRDESGQALLDNIITAAKGQKLLASNG